MRELTKTLLQGLCVIIGNKYIILKNMNETKTGKGFIIGVIVLILIVLGTWVWVKYGDNLGKSPVTDTETVDETPTMSITAKHQFKNGKHIIAGEVNLPTPCYVLDTQAMVAESMPEQVTIAFTSTTQGEICAQVVTTERFKVDFTASKEASIKATWNGKPATLNLIPAGENEDLNNFEIFLKG